MDIRLNVALLGASHPHSRGHLRTLQLAEEVASILVWDEDQQVLNRLQQEMGHKIAETTTDLTALLQAGDIQAGVVVVPNDQAPQVTIKALEAGIPLLCEKPMATSSTNLEPILQTAKRVQLPVSVCYQWRFHPISRDIRRFIQEGYLGRVMSVEARMVTSQVKFRNPNHWLFKKKRAGGGILSWLGCHWLDLIRFLLADEVSDVTAMVATLNGFPIEVEDTAVVNMRFRGGALGTLHAGYLLPRSRAGYVGASYDTHLAIRGTSGYIAWSPVDPSMTVHFQSVAGDWSMAPARRISYQIPPSDAYGGYSGFEFMRQFLCAAVGQDTPPNSAEDAMRVMQIVEAAYRSSSSGKAVPVKENG